MALEIGGYTLNSNREEHDEHQQTRTRGLAEEMLRSNGRSAVLRDIDALHLFKDEFSIEIDLIRQSDASVQVDGLGYGIRFNDQTCAQVLFGEKASTIDRIALQMLAVKWLLDGSSEKFAKYFTNFQDEEYFSLQFHCKHSLASASDVLVLLVLIVSISLAKYGVFPESSSTSTSRGARLSFEALAYRAVRESSISCVQQLRHDQIEEISECLRIASSCNLSALATGELVSGNIAAFKSAHDSRVVSKAFDTYFIFCAIQAQHASLKGTLVFNQLLAIQKQIKDLIAGQNKLTTRQAYNNLLAQRGEALEKKGFRSLSLNDPEERSLLRLVIMGQAVSRSRAEWFARAFYGLPTEQRASLVKGLNADGEGGEIAVVPLGMHDLFEEGLKQRRGSVATLVKALESLMRFLVRIFESAKSITNSGIKIIEFRVDFALDAVKNVEFEENPLILDDLEIPLPTALEDVRNTTDDDLPDSHNFRPISNALVVQTTISLSSTPVIVSPMVINVKTCRVCSNEFTYTHPGGDIKIVCGVPAGNYKAISYVWGNVTQVTVRCGGCLAISMIPMESSDKFSQLMSLAGGNSTVWLDAISINQQDHQDIAKQVAVMGDIYSKADCVSVLLPASDVDAFTLLANLVQNAKHIQSSPWLFTQGDRDSEHEAMGAVCQSFFANLSAMSCRQKQWVYWQRAWTFQEWALAIDLEVWCEGLSTTTAKLKDVKRNILATAMFLARYKLAAHQYSSVDIGFPRGYVPEYLRVVKRLFPREDLFLSDDEIDPEKLLMQTMFPHGEIDQILGLRGPLQAPGFQSRLSLMLDALGNNQRQARFEADLICCWASMCNIKYAYDKRDSYAVALQKVLAALRCEGVQIFNFHVNTSARLEVDLQFGDYSMAHQLSNVTNKAFLPKAPIYSGHTDTIFHLLHSLKQSGELAPLGGPPIALRPVARTSTTVVELSEQVAVVHQMSRIVQGELDDGGFTYSSILNKILEVLDGFPQSQLDDFLFVVVDIPVVSMLPWKNGSPTGERKVAAWAICPRRQVFPHSSLKVAREALNGTLVLATESSIGAPLQAVAYLTITHAQCGSYLLVANDEGLIEISFVTPKRSDILVTINGDLPNEGMHVRVDFEDQ